MADDDLFDDDFEFDDEDDYDSDDEFDDDDDDEKSDIEVDDQREDEQPRPKQPPAKSRSKRGAASPKSTPGKTQPAAKSPAKKSPKKPAASSSATGRGAGKRVAKDNAPPDDVEELDRRRDGVADDASRVDEVPPPEDDGTELETSEAREPQGPPADHLVHVYEFGQLLRTLPRKFTDEEAVCFAEEYTRTGKAYGRLAVAMPDDETPAASFADAAKG